MNRPTLIACIFLFFCAGVASRRVGFSHAREADVGSLTIGEFFDRTIPVRPAYSAVARLAGLGNKALNVGLNKTREATKQVTTDMEGITSDTSDILFKGGAIGKNPTYLVSAVYQTFKADKPKEEEVPQKVPLRIVA